MVKALKVCSCIGCAAHPGSCPELTDKRHCQRCASAAETARGSRHQRGYGTAHDRVRRQLLTDLVPGTPCPKCGLPMRAADDLDAGHSQDLRDNPNALADQLEHASCNRAWRRGQRDAE